MFAFYFDFEEVKKETACENSIKNKGLKVLEGFVNSLRQSCYVQTLSFFTSHFVILSHPEHYFVQK